MRGVKRGENKKGRSEKSHGNLQVTDFMYSHIKGLHPELPSPGQSRDTAAQRRLQTEP